MVLDITTRQIDDYYATTTQRQGRGNKRADRDTPRSTRAYKSSIPINCRPAITRAIREQSVQDRHDLADAKEILANNEPTVSLQEAEELCNIRPGFIPAFVQTSDAQRLIKQGILDPLPNFEKRDNG